MYEGLPSMAIVAHKLLQKPLLLPQGASVAKAYAALLQLKHAVAAVDASAASLWATIAMEDVSAGQADRHQANVGTGRGTKAGVRGRGGGGG